MLNISSVPVPVLTKTVKVQIVSSVRGWTLLTVCDAGTGGERGAVPGGARSQPLVPVQPVTVGRRAALGLHRGERRPVPAGWRQARSGTQRQFTAGHTQFSSFQLFSNITLYT